MNYVGNFKRPRLANGKVSLVQYILYTLEYVAEVTAARFILGWAKHLDAGKPFCVKAGELTVPSSVGNTSE